MEFSSRSWPPRGSRRSACGMRAPAGVLANAADRAGTGAQARRRRRRRGSRNPAAPGAGVRRLPGSGRWLRRRSRRGRPRTASRKPAPPGKPSTAAQIAARIASLGDPEPRKTQRRGLQRRPGSDDVQRRGAEHLATSRVAIESNERLHCAGRNPRAFDRLGARFCKKPAARAILPSESRRHRGTPRGVESPNGGQLGRIWRRGRPPTKSRSGDLDPATFEIAQVPIYLASVEE